MTYHKVVFQPLGLAENCQCFLKRAREIRRGLVGEEQSHLQNCYGAPSYYCLPHFHKADQQTGSSLGSCTKVASVSNEEYLDFFSSCYKKFHSLKSNVYSVKVCRIETLLPEVIIIVCPYPRPCMCRSISLTTARCCVAAVA